MRQLTCTGPRQIEWQRRPGAAAPGRRRGARPPARRRALRHRSASSIAGLLPPRGPFALGHEGVVEIVALGDAVRGLAVGQRVVVSFQVSCGTLRVVRRRPHRELRRLPGALRLRHAAALGRRVRRHALGPGPRAARRGDARAGRRRGSIPVALASVSDNVLDGYRGVAPHLRDAPGRATCSSCVTATRASRSTRAQTALALGAGRVDFASDDAERARARREARRAAGRDRLRAPRSAATRSSSTPGSAPRASTTRSARTEPEGICQSVSFYVGADTPMPLGKLYTLGIRFFIGRAHAAALLPEVMPLIEAGTAAPGRGDDARRRLGGRAAGVSRGVDQARRRAFLGGYPTLFMSTSEPSYPGAVAPERSRDFESSGIRLRLHEWGDPDAAPVVLCHGMFDHGRGFDTLAPLLAERFRVVAIDARGHGDSGWADAYTWTERRRRHRERDALARPPVSPARPQQGRRAGDRGVVPVPRPGPPAREHRRLRAVARGLPPARLRDGSAQPPRALRDVPRSAPRRRGAELARVREPRRPRRAPEAAEPAPLRRVAPLLPALPRRGPSKAALVWKADPLRRPRLRTVEAGVGQRLLAAAAGADARGDRLRARHVGTAPRGAPRRAARADRAARARHGRGLGPLRHMERPRETAELLLDWLER